ncbi:MAG: carboxypeptidase regulatory-like domain-containing protein, partial [Nitrospira sp.]|nr:carboxypeptidase regulatory-like domain-containing protein [Nitrospira sp.]
MMYSFMRRVLNGTIRLTVAAVICGTCSISYAEDRESTKTIKGVVQNQDLRRVPQAVIEVKNQEGDIISSGVSNDAGEFKVTVPEEGTYSVSAVQETYRSEYVVLALGEEPLKPVTLTLSKTKEVSLEVVAPLPPINTKASSETYSLSRKEIDILPRGNNNDLHDVLLTIPGAAYG